MMMAVSERRFSGAVRVRRPCAVAFAWVADHRNASRALDGVTRWEPLGRKVAGVGARFDVEMSVFGFPLRAVLVLDRWEPPRALGWRSESGIIAQRGGWRFTPVEDGCEVTLTIAYQPPGGLAGGLVARQADGAVRRRLGDAMERMRDALEGDAPAG